jgi:peptidoglycan/xylan/chitin deacetylase (PgdA/CDA1 family)
VWRVSTNSKELFLTFDDGPVPGPTDFVLETLNHYNIKATFFCIGENITKHRELFTKISATNNEIGNHTFNHVKGWNCTVQQYTDNVEKCATYLGDHQKLFRPPYGRIKASQIKALANHKIVMWDVLTQDYDQNLAQENCLKGSIKATRPGSIIVFHDSYKAEKNLKYVLPRFIEHFLNLGFQFKKLEVD